jgi:hypothetical protein
MGLKLNKSRIGIPQKCIKLACEYISETLQGIVPDILKISKVTPVDKGGEITDPANFRPISTLSTITQIFEKLIYKNLSDILKRKIFFFNFNLVFGKVVLLPKQ